MEGNSWLRLAGLEPTAANKPVPKNMWDVYDPSVGGLDSTAADGPDQQQLNKISTATTQVDYFAGIPRGDWELMRGAVAIPGNTVKVQAIPHEYQTDLGSGNVVQAALVIGLLLFTTVLLFNKNRSVFGRFLKPVLFIGWSFALLLGAGVLSGIKDWVIASSRNPEVTGLSVGLMYGVYAVLMGFLIRKIWRIKALTVAVEQVPVVQIPVPHPKHDDTVYLVIATELDSGKTDRGLWTRLFAECDGDDARTRAAYIRARAVQLQRGN